MIRINLLPIRQTRKRETVQQQLVAFVMVLSVTILACFTWWHFVNKELQETTQEIAKKEKEIAQLQQIIGKVSEHTAKKKELQAKLQVIRQLKKGKTGPVRALDDLATEIPKRVWVTKMSESAGSVKFVGRAIDHEDVSAFMKALQKSKYFDNIVLTFSKAAAPIGGTQFYEFEIECTVDYSA